MNGKKLLCLVSVAAFATSVAAQPPANLVVLAKQEKQRRAKMQSSGGTAKVYTESDRPAGAETTTTTEGTPTGDPAAAVAAGAKKGKEKTPEEMAADKQKEWNDKVKDAQDKIKDLEGVIATNERNLASMINITPMRADLANRIEADKAKLAGLRQTLVSLEDERRRAGMPRSK